MLVSSALRFYLAEGMGPRLAVLFQDFLPREEVCSLQIFNLTQPSGSFGYVYPLQLRIASEQPLVPCQMFWCQCLNIFRLHLVCRSESFSKKSLVSYENSVLEMYLASLVNFRGMHLVFRDR